MLTAREGSRVCARLEGRLLAPRLFHARRFQAAVADRAAEAQRAFARAVAAHFGDQGGAVLAWMDEKSAAWRAALEDVDFRLARRKAFVERDLTGDLPPASGGFTLRSLAEVGERAFLARKRAVAEGDPFEERRGPEPGVHSPWSELLEYAGERFDPNRWWLVDDADGPVGVLLPQKTSADTGTVFYVGVLPARRGRGLGVRLHALGLHHLARQGARKYVGSTDLRNVAMLRVFERNGCCVTGTQGFFVRTAGASP